MALDLSSPGRTAAIDDDGEHVIARLPAELGIKAPQCARLWNGFYENPHLDGGMVGPWRAELVAMREALAARRGRPAPRTLEVLDALIALCEDALAHRAGIRADSD